MIPTIMQDPHDSSCSVAWDDLTTEKQAEALKLFKQIVNRANKQWVIKISLKGPPVPNEGRWGETWPHVIYPVQFASYEDAWAYGIISPDPDLRPPGFKSWSVEAVRHRRDYVIPHPRVRKTDLIENPQPKKRKPK